jgi:hypothetical protein
VSWIVVVVMIVVIQLMVLFDVIHVVNTKSPEASDKSFLYTALEVFCLGEVEVLTSREKIYISNSKLEVVASLLHFDFWIFDDGIELPFLLNLNARDVRCKLMEFIDTPELFHFNISARLESLFDIRGSKKNVRHRHGWFIKNMKSSRIVRIFNKKKKKKLCRSWKLAGKSFAFLEI